MEHNVPISFINKEFNEHDCYIVELIINNNLRAPNRTFFPAEWSSEKVTSKITEAFNNFKKSNIKPILNRKGRYIIRGFTNEGLEIEMVLTQDNEVQTAYPVIN